MPNQIAFELEGAAREALFKTKALRLCPAHSEVKIRVGDPDAEHRAYALATTILKGKQELYLREHLMEAIKQELVMASDDGCPACASRREG
jgi:hypothetical protein